MTEYQTHSESHLIPDRRRKYFNVDLKTIGAFCGILVFLGTVIGLIAKQSDAQVNATQNENIVQLQAKAENLQNQITQVRADYKEDNQKVQTKIDALLHALGLDPASVLAKAQHPL